MSANRPNVTDDAGLTSMLQFPVPKNVLRDIGIIARQQGKTLRQYMAELTAEHVAEKLVPIPAQRGKHAK